MQYDQPVHVFDIEMSVGMQSLEENTSSVPLTVNEPVIILHLDEVNNENETTHIPTPPSNDVQFDLLDVQVSLSSSDKEHYHVNDIQEMQPEPDPIDHDLPTSLKVKYSDDVNVPASKVNGWEGFPVDTGPSLLPFF